MPQLNYTYPEDNVRAGDLVDGRSGHKKFASYSYAQLFDTYTATVGGTADDGDYSFTVNGHLVSFTADASGGDTNDDIAAGLAAALEAHLELMQVAAATSAGAVVTIPALTAGQKLTLADATAPGTGTLVIANTVDSDRDDLDVGIVLASDDGITVRPPTTGDTAADFVGVSVLSEPLLRPSSFDALDSEEDGYPSGMTIPVGGDGDFVDVWLHAEEGLTMGTHPYVRIVATGSERAGAIRSDADGSDAVQWTGLTVLKTTSAAGLCAVRVRR